MVPARDAMKRLRRRDIEVGKLYVVRRSALGERLWKLGWWAAHVPSGTLQVVIHALTLGVISPQRGTEPPSGTVLRATGKTKILGVTFVVAATGEPMQVSPALVAPNELGPD